MMGCSIVSQNALFLCFQNPSKMTTKVQIEKVNTSNVPMFYLNDNTVGSLCKYWCHHIRCNQASSARMVCAQADRQQ